jgi:UDP-N-acetyl-D-glucosamine dehydrogenase
MLSVPLTDEALRSADLVLIVTDHAGVDYERVLREAPLILDTRGVIRKGGAGKLVRLSGEAKA